MLFFMSVTVQEQFKIMNLKRGVGIDHSKDGKDTLASIATKRKETR